jgi:general secretion pathway protein J
MGQFRGAESTKDTELVRIVYTREGDRLLRFVRRNLYGLTDESVEQVELAAKVKGFNVRYYDGKSKLWVDEWDGRGRTGTPKALLIELTVMPDSGMTPSTKSQLTISQENAELQTVRQWVAVGPSS